IHFRVGHECARSRSAWILRQPIAVDSNRSRESSLMKTMTTTFLSATAFAAALLGACGDNDNVTSVNEGHLVVRLSDAAAVIDSLKSVDVFVVRIDGRVAAASDAEAESNVDQPASGGWIPLATPNTSFNLLALQDRVSSPLGDAIVRAATYEGFRIIIDP